MIDFVKTDGILEDICGINTEKQDNQEELKAF